MSIFAQALKKITEALDQEGIAYMLVGGFAVSYHNRARTTNDIDLVLQIYPRDIPRLLHYFPEWKGFAESFADDVRTKQIFNITDFDTGIRYDFMAYQDSDYNWTAFERREKVSFFGIDCYLATKEDLIISKLTWYNISESEKQFEDFKFLLLDEKLDMQYIQAWVSRLRINTHGLLE